MTEIRETIAPHVEPAWLEEVLLELRLQGVSGERIGAALAEVEAHVVDSGQSAAEAFGDPTEYARSLELPPSPEQSRTATVKGIVPTLVQLLGMVCVCAAMPWGQGTVVVTTTLLAGLVLAVLVSLAAAAFGDVLLRAVVSHPVVVWIGCTLGVGVLAGGLVAANRLGLERALFDLPGMGVLVAGLAALAIGTWMALRSGADAPDLITSPVPGRGTGRPGVRHWVWVALPIPVATVALAAILSLI
ncbi:MAG: hypothetical protein KBG85_09055 [Micropruina sp.]|nr:hypothetical protein [Micropruina sp.]